MNIADAYTDERFNRKVDIQTGYHTESLLCLPSGAGLDDVWVSCRCYDVGGGGRGTFSRTLEGGGGSFHQVGRTAYNRSTASPSQLQSANPGTYPFWNNVASTRLQHAADWATTSYRPLR